LLDFLKRLLGKKPTAPPGDPYAYVMAPVRRGPTGRSGAAVAEIETIRIEAFLRAVEAITNQVNLSAFVIRSEAKSLPSACRMESL